MIVNLCDRELSLYRTTMVANDTGGYTETRSLVSSVWVRVSQPTASEIALARTEVGPQQGGAILHYRVYADPLDTFYRNDELQDDATGEVFRVADVIAPSAAFYVRLDCVLTQAQPNPEV